MEIKSGKIGARNKTNTKELILVKTKKETVQALFIYFLIYSLLGWILESTYAMIINRQFVNRGFLFGPFCPIYGFGAILIIILLSNSKGKPLKEFVIAAFTFTIFEYAVSFALEAVFGLRWWDYTGELLNLQGRVSLMYSILWGALGIILIEWIQPIVEKGVKKIKKYISLEVENAIVTCLIIYVLLDFVVSCGKYLKL